MTDALKADFQAVADKNGIDFTITQEVVVTTTETDTFTHNA